MNEREEFDRWHLNKYGWMDKHAFETAEAAQRYEVWLSAKESSRKELEAAHTENIEQARLLGMGAERELSLIAKLEVAKQRIADLESDVKREGAATQYNYEIILKLREQIEALEKKLAEQQLVLQKLNWLLFGVDWNNGTHAKHHRSDSVKMLTDYFSNNRSEELTKQLAAGRQQGFDEATAGFDQLRLKDACKEIIELRKELEEAKKMSMCELMTINASAKEYAEHWEARTLKAEIARLKERDTVKLSEQYLASATEWHKRYTEACQKHNDFRSIKGAEIFDLEEQLFATRAEVMNLKKALANTNPNSAEIERLKVEIELLDSLSAEFFQSQDRGGAKYDIQRKAEQRRARLAELTKGE